MTSGSAIRTDTMMRVPALQVADAHAAHHATTYVYRFDWSSPAIGAAHAIDLPFTFGTFDREGWDAVVGYDARAESLGVNLRGGLGCVRPERRPEPRRNRTVAALRSREARRRCSSTPAAAVADDPAGATRAVWY